MSKALKLFEHIVFGEYNAGLKYMALEQGVERVQRICLAKTDERLKYVAFEQSIETKRCIESRQFEYLKYMALEQGIETSETSCWYRWSQQYTRLKYLALEQRIETSSARPLTTRAYVSSIWPLSKALKRLEATGRTGLRHTSQVHGP